MNTMRWVRVSVLLCCLPFSGTNSAREGADRSLVLDTVKIEQLAGVKGKFDEAEEVFKVSLPRSDLAVTVAGVEMIPAMGLTSWSAFKAAGDRVMLTGDIALREDQVNPILSLALDNGIEVTALHNHFLWDTPKFMFMHIGGLGELEKLASGVGKIFQALKTTAFDIEARKFVATDKTSIDPNSIETIIGTPVEQVGGVFKVTIGRTTSMAGHEAGKAMGVNTWAVFAGSNEQAVVDGDFAMLESELQRVLKALRQGGILITAIHHHMIGESPKIILLHYWGTGPVADLAKTIKSALNTQSK